MSEQQMTIIGAGMAGLMCGIMNPGSQIVDRAKGENDMPDHSALFRLRTDAIAKITGIPMKKVTVRKAIYDGWEEVTPTIAAINQYSMKTTGRISPRSIMNTDTCERYIPPPDFIQQLRKKAPDVLYGVDAADVISTRHGSSKIGPVVSTIPMPSLAKYLHVSDPAPFAVRPIYVTTFMVLDCDMHCTIYYPDDFTPIYRASLISSNLIVESMAPIDAADAKQLIVHSMGIPVCNISSPTIKNKRQMPGKITPIHSGARKNFILDATIKHNIYSLGRLATWRPKVMLDDVVEDVYQIRMLIEGGNYAAKTYNQKEHNQNDV